MAAMGMGPRMFGHPTFCAVLSEDGQRVLAVGGPGEGTPETWQYVAYGGASGQRRRTAEDLLQLAGVYRNLLGPSMVLKGGYFGLRTRVGHFLLARDGDGWYVAAVAGGDIRRPPLHVFNELRRAAEWVRATPEVQRAA